MPRLAALSCAPLLVLLLAGCTGGSDTDTGDDPDGSLPTVCDGGANGTSGDQGGTGSGGNATSGTGTTSSSPASSSMTGSRSATETCVPAEP